MNGLDTRALRLYDEAHGQRVAILAQAIAGQMGMNEEDSERIGMTGLLHDMGKTRIPRTVLDKPGRLTEEETATVRQHCQLGKEAIEALPSSRFPWLTPELREMAAEVALLHHERLDGSGYYGRQVLSLPVRIVAVADVYDALTHDRPYRRGWPPGVALDYLAQYALGNAPQFDLSVALALHVCAKLPTIHLQQELNESNAG